MKKVRVVLLVGGAILVLGVVSFLVLRAPDPVYEGKRLSAWILDLDGYAGPKMDKAQKAIGHIGPEAVPYVRGLLGTRDSGFKLWVNKMLAKQSFTKFRFPEVHSVHSRGLFACEALATNARPIIPDLAALIYDSKCCRHAGYVLVRFGTEITPILTNANKSADPRIRWGSIASMAVLNDPTTVPFLLRVMEDPDADVRMFATEVLGYVSKDPEVGLPALLKALQDKDQRVQSAAAFRLDLWVQYPQAKAAVPLLLKIIDETAKAPPSDFIASNLRRNATNTLIKLDPKAAAEGSRP